jgi:putative sigma-54 modulation protein
MQITVSAKHTDISPALRAAAEEKIGRLDRFVEDLEYAEVHFSEEKNTRIADKEVCEITLEGHGHHVRCKVAAPDGFVAIDRAVEKLEHQLHKLKTKLVHQTHGKRAVVAPVAGTNGGGAVVLDDDLDADPMQGLRIVRTKSFAIKPMTPAEAVSQMDLLGHDFFFFTNADTGRAALVYRRDDGDVGLIDEAG